MTNVCITKYNAICNLGSNIGEIARNIETFGCEKLIKDSSFVKGTEFFFGEIKSELPTIKNEKFNTRANKLLLKCLENIDIQDILTKYSKDKIGIVIATTNTGVEEFSQTNNPICSEIGNPAMFLKEHLGLNSYSAGISTACSSGIKTFSTALKLLENKICDAVIAGGVDSLANVAIHGFNSLEILSKEKTNPFSKNRNGINIGEAAALFVLERTQNGIKIAGIGETSDAYHISTPEPTGTQAANAMKIALEKADLAPESIDYINLHGTGTKTNDEMEANAVFSVFQDKPICNSTKSVTGHCLGAAASLETAICCYSLENNIIFKHVYDGHYDENLPKINLAEKTIKKDLKYALCNAFGFGGTNSAIILEKNNEN